VHAGCWFDDGGEQSGGQVVCVAGYAHSRR
jgi:hypothetical protein